MHSGSIAAGVSAVIIILGCGLGGSMQGGVKHAATAFVSAAPAGAPVAAADTRPAGAPAALPGGPATVAAALRGLYQSGPEVNCGDGGAALVLTGNTFYAESQDSTCAKSSAVTAVTTDGPFTMLTLADGTSLRLKAKPDGLSVSGDGARYLAGSYSKDSAVTGAESWSAGTADAIPAELQKEFKGCPTVNCNDGVTVTLTATSFYTESTDSTCALSGPASSIAQDGPYTILVLPQNKRVHIRPTAGGIRIAGPDARYLAGDYSGAGGSCPAVAPAAASSSEPDAEEPEEESEGGTACEEYEECCSDYVDALGEVAGLEGMVDSAGSACDGIDALSGLTGGDAACASALDGLKQVMVAYTAMPGFVVPSSCR
jgi:hypothetical protein